MNEALSHQINQRLTTITNFASTTEVILNRRMAEGAPLTEREMAEARQWMETIQLQCFQIRDLLQRQREPS